MTKGATFDMDVKRIMQSVDWVVGSGVRIVDPWRKRLEEELQDILADVWDEGYCTAQDEVDEWHRPGSGLE